MRRILCLFMSVLVGWIALAGDIRRISLTYDYLSDRADETPAQAVQTALLRAKQKALEEQFGIAVSSVQSTLVHTRAEGENASSTTDLFALNEVAAKGEWIETIEEKVISKEYRNGFWQVRVYVEGKARSLSAQKTDIRYAFINNAHDRDTRAVFYDEDDLFLRFSSPVEGALCVYLVDESMTAYCLLPYQSAGCGFQSVMAGKDYLFFSSSAEQDADEYVLTTQRASEQNALFVVFSPNTFTKANDREGGFNWREERMPRQLPYGDFIRWLARNQSRDPEMVVRKEVITIRR